MCTYATTYVHNSGNMYCMSCVWQDRGHAGHVTWQHKINVQKSDIPVLWRTSRYWHTHSFHVLLLSWTLFVCQTICTSLTLCTCSLVVKLRECWGKSIVNFALLPVTPVLFTWSILYWACKDGNRAAVMLRLCNIIKTFTELLVHKVLITRGQLCLEKCHWRWISFKQGVSINNK